MHMTEKTTHVSLPNPCDIIQQAGRQAVFSQIPQLVEGSMVYSVDENWHWDQIASLPQAKIFHSMTDLERALQTREEDRLCLVAPSVSLSLPQLEILLARSAYQQTLVLFKPL